MASFAIHIDERDGVVHFTIVDPRTSYFSGSRDTLEEVLEKYREVRKEFFDMEKLRGNVT